MHALSSFANTSVTLDDLQGLYCRSLRDTAKQTIEKVAQKLTYSASYIQATLKNTNDLNLFKLFNLG